MKNPKLNPNPHVLPFAKGIISTLYNLPRNRIVSNAEVRAEVANLIRRANAGTLDDIGETMFAQMEQKQVIIESDAE